MNKMEAKQNIENFMLQRGYTYTPQDIIEIYVEYYKKDFYISHTMEDCVKHLKKELEIIIA